MDYNLPFSHLRKTLNTYPSWGRYPKAQASQIITPLWRNDPIEFDRIPESVLPYGRGRSYGDICLNNSGALIDTSQLNHFLSFDPLTGLLRAESGVTFADILEYFVPRGWFLPVTPGTQFITLGGAIANDIHGKNHHGAGTFGCHVKQFELLRSQGERLICSPHQNAELFRATIGGLGLTGLILWAEFEMKKIPSPWIKMFSTKFEHLDEFFILCQETDQKFDYSVAWIDCFSTGKSLGRGHFLRGNFADIPQGKKPRTPRRLPLRMPVDAPPFLLHAAFMKIFNEIYYSKQKNKTVTHLEHYPRFFYPLDSIDSWNRLYGKRGFLQYQCVVPLKTNGKKIREILEKISRANAGSFLAVLKIFGDIRSPGMMSFPRKGVTLALDFPNEGEKIFNLLDELDEMVGEAGGAVNPSKDARMQPRHFAKFFPQWQEFLKYMDPKFSSSFWRRVTRGILSKELQ